MFIKSIDLDNVEKFFVAFSQKNDFILDENNLSLTRKNENTDELSLLIYPDIDEIDYAYELFEIIEQVVFAYKGNKMKSKFLQECIINQRSWKEARSILQIGKRTYFTWRQEILADAIFLAIDRGLLKINL